MTSKLLKLFLTPYTKMASDLINARSSGIKDLRHGFLLEQDWYGKEPSALNIHDKTNVALLRKVSYCIIAGSLFKNENSLASKMLGDGMVHAGSAKKLDHSGFSTNITIANVTSSSHHELTHSEAVFNEFKKLM